MEKIDLSTNSRKIQDSYDKLIRGDPSITYVVYSLDKNSTLDVTETGNGSLDDFIENFTDGQVQFGLARVTVPGSDVSKNILLGWCPDNSPSKARLSFASNFAEVSKVLSGYHVQITARDQDDLDVDEFLNRVCAAAGARYSVQGAATGSSTKKSTSSPAPKPVVSKPIVSKPAIHKPTGPKPSFIPRSTGKPVQPVKSPGFVQSTKPPKHDDGWGDAKDVEERDFDQKPLESVPSAYKPTKVNIDDLRKQKSDTISSTPKASSFKPQDKEEDDKPKPLSERMKAYNDPNDGRLTSLPKPKVAHSVASRYAPSATSSGAPSFGSKPVIGAKPAQANKLVGGASRDFGSQGGKTPAQIWAEKRGQYKTVAGGEEPVKSAGGDELSHTSELVSQFEQKAHIQDEQEEEEPKEEVKAPVRNLPPPPVRHVVPEPEPEEEEEEEEEEEPAPSLPSRTAAPEPEEEEQEEEAAPAPSLPSRAAASAPEPKEESITATAEYDYEKDEDNEIAFAEGDLIVDIEFTDEEWWTGKHSKTGEVGLFPAAYVSLNEKKADEVPEKPQEEEDEAAPAPSLPSRSEPKVEAKPTATAEYDYEKDEDNEIGFEEGEIIVDIDFVDDDWWSGKREKTGEVGLFPANYVKLN
ncbi:ABP1 [[Candida] subhashii]|uniref:ABP1 n=1 Tax=[Candida] subhashii TaxID=561895 RepID=A0A8J5QLF0_9ASCO|nr:ABP1 [[Candida] subhashii]KAG7662741.1 ABP1 [[Candida] subhashii]